MTSYIDTIRLSKRLLGVPFHKRTNKAVSEIRKYCAQKFHAQSVVIDQGVNNFVWSQGRRNPPRRIRVKIVKAVENDQVTCTVSHEPVKTFKGLMTVKTEEVE